MFHRELFTVCQRDLYIYRAMSNIDVVEILKQFRRFIHNKSDLQMISKRFVTIDVDILCDSLIVVVCCELRPLKDRYSEIS